MPSALATVPNAHIFRLGSDVALLHHACTQPQAEVEWDPAADWWACQEPDRSLDEHTHFELNCPACAQRWGDKNLS